MAYSKNQKNNPNNVSTGKPKVGGAVFVAPAGTALPADGKTALDAKYVCLGCISEDGVTQKMEHDADEIKDWEGNTVEVADKGYDESYEMTFIEHMNVDVLKTIYTDGKVEESGGKITIKHSGETHDELVFVIETLLKGNKINRLVIPRGKITEIGDVTRKRDEAIGYEVTVKALSDDKGNTAYEYIEALGA